MRVAEQLDRYVRVKEHIGAEPCDTKFPLLITLAVDQYVTSDETKRVVNVDAIDWPLADLCGLIPCDDLLEKLPTGDRRPLKSRTGTDDRVRRHGAAERMLEWRRASE